MKNTLIVVGIGIKFLSHITTETKVSIEKSDKVLYLVNDPAMKSWIKNSNINSESLDRLYNTNCPRNENYLLISEYVNEVLNNTKVLCFVMYGHPTFLADPSLNSIKMAMHNGHEVVILPGISSEDCLFADLMIDPSSCGCQTYEATDFLIYEREYDTSCHLILYQASMLGIKVNYNNQNSEIGLQILTEYLLNKYDKEHTVILYEAAQYPSFKPIVKKIQLLDLSKYQMSPITTLYIPPNRVKQPNKLYVSILNNIKK